MSPLLSCEHMPCVLERIRTLMTIRTYTYIVGGFHPCHTNELLEPYTHVHMQHTHTHTHTCTHTTHTHTTHTHTHTHTCTHAQCRHAHTHTVCVYRIHTYVYVPIYHTVLMLLPIKYLHHCTVHVICILNCHLRFPSLSLILTMPAVPS